MLEAFLKYNFLQNAVFSGLLASVVCGIIGTVVLEKRLVMMSGGIAHASFGGVGLGYFLNFEPIYGALIFSLISSLGIATIKRRTNTNPDTLVGLFWALGMASGILFIAFTPGYPPDISTYLFGDILTVTQSDLNLMIILAWTVILFIGLLFNYWKAYLFDEEFLAVLGLKIAYFDYLLFALIALTAIVLIRVVGIILVIALLTAPPAIARFFTSDLKEMMIGAIILGFFFNLAGLLVSYVFNIASGATIILLACAAYFLIAVFRFKPCPF